MNVLFFDFKQLFEEKLTQLSRQETVIAVYLQHRHRVLGALTHLLKINLADVLLGKASTENMDVLLLTFSEYAQAKKVFYTIPKNWHLEEGNNNGLVHVQLWHQGQLEAENI
jgi:hypothetical protein